MKLLSSLAGGLAGAAMGVVINKALLPRRSKSPLMRTSLYIAATVVSAAVTNWLNRKKQHLVSPYNPPIESYKPVLDITV